MHLVKSLVKQWLLKKNIILSRPPGQFSLDVFKLAAAKRRGLEVSLAVDGGAADGGWTREFKAIYPDAQVLAIEPRDEAQPSLQQLAREMKGIHLAQTLVGDHDGTIEFFKHGPQSSTLKNSRGQGFGERVVAPITTLDSLVTKMGLPDPDFIKLDLQGAELQCLDGASRCLQHAQAVFLELSFIAFQEGMPLIGDVLPYMKERGFRCYDVMGLWHRPLDGALAQGDFLFVSEDSPLVTDRRWSTVSTWA